MCLAVRRALVFAAPPDTVVLLGDVGETQKVSKGASDRHGGIERQGREFVGEMSERVLIALTGRLRHGANPLDNLKDRLAFEGA